MMIPAVFLLSLFIIYSLFWPVEIDPVAWNAPENRGYTGVFKTNNRLKNIHTIPIGNSHGPEDVAIDSDGRIYAATHEGNIVRLDADGSNPVNWVNTGGRPLGIDFDHSGNLIVADAFIGLLSIDKDGSINTLATMADNIPIRYADDVDVAADGKIYFSDASTKFGAKEYGGAYEASILELMEHGGHGRLLVYDPLTGTAKTLVDGLNFANGVAVSHDQSYVLINDTGTYRVIRYWLTGPDKGKHEILIDELPAFPDNISTGYNNRFWVAFVAPRNKLVDSVSNKPFLRRMIQRLPKFLKPKAVFYGHIIAIDGNGKILHDLQDPAGSYPLNTSVTETKEYLYIGSLVSPVLGRIEKKSLGIE